MPGIEELSFEELRLTPVQAGAIITQLYMNSITDNDFQAVFRKIYDEYYTIMAEIFDYGKDSGKFTGTDTKTVVLQLMAMIEELYRRQ